MLKLPIDDHLDFIVSSLQSSSQVILTATPGAGKTTRLPPQLLSTVKGKVAILQPRRMAAISACQFVADENKWKVGEQVGYQVRQDSKFNHKTRLLFMTDAILLRRLIDDPELKDFDLIVIDEFHERNLNQDVILAVLKELQQLGRDIKILIMSATLDMSELKNYLPESVMIDIPGQVYPLQIQYSNQPLSLQTDFSFIQRVSNAVTSLDVLDSVDDILVFLPGVGEIQRVKAHLLEKKINRDIFVLHGSLNLKDQKSVLEQHSKPRVILATNIAEASVTVRGVNAVIDTGLSRVLTTNYNSGFSILNLSSISKFNAKQRAGRAAREKPGQCLRLWTIHEESSKEDQLPPEIQRLDLSSSVLLLSYLGISQPKTFSWFTHPPDILLLKAQTFLKNINAIDDFGALTLMGHRLLTFPLEPRYGAFIFRIENLINSNEAQAQDEAENLILDLSVKLVALLQDKDIMSSKQNAVSSSESDILDRLQFLEDYESGNLKSQDVNLNTIRNVLETAEQLKKIVRTNKSLDLNIKQKIETNPNSKIKQQQNLKSTNPVDDQKAIFELLLQTQSDRLCRRRLNTDRGLMVGGRGVKLSPSSAVHKSEFFLSLSGRDISGQSETLVDIAHGFSKAEVLQILKYQIQNFEQPFYDSEKGQFYLKKGRRFKDLDLDQPTLTKIAAEDLGDKFIDLLVLRWPEIINNHKGLTNWISRWEFFNQHHVEVPLQEEPQKQLKKELNNQFLTNEQIKSALEMASLGHNQMDQILKQDLVYFIETQIESQILKEFKSKVPKDFHAPSGGVHPIIYSLVEAPYVEVRLQEVFGLIQTPKVGVNQTPLVFKLLAPNFRPVQVTSDIEGFWKRSYVEVRKELRGRYPKHSWPDDPLTAIPVQKGKRRSI